MDEIQAMIHLKNFEQHSVGSDLGNESENSKKQEEDAKNIRKYLRQSSRREWIGLESNHHFDLGARHVAKRQGAQTYVATDRRRACHSDRPRAVSATDQDRLDSSAA